MGAKINAQDKDGHTPLMYAIYHPQASMRTSVIEYLLNDENIDLDVKTNDGMTALDLANKKGLTEIAHMIKKSIWLKAHPEQREHAQQVRDERRWQGWSNL